MNDRTNRTVICSIAFLDIVDYSKRVGQEQLVLKEHFNSLISEVVKDIAQNDRVLIDTGDGAALCFMGAPEDALFVSMNLRDSLRTPESEAIGLTVRFGINLGPVRMIHDINGHQNVIGDGINVAQRVMSFAEPNQIMVSRSYFEVVSRLSKEYTLLFHYAGARTDKHVREHEVFEVGPGKDDPATIPMMQPQSAAGSIADAPPSADSVAAAASPRASVMDEPADAASVPVPAPARNKWLVPGAIVAVVVLAAGIFLGTQLNSKKASEPAQVETPATMSAADAAATRAAGSTPGAKSDSEAKVSPPVVGSVPAVNPHAEATVLPPAVGSVPGSKHDAEAKVSPPAAGLSGAKSDAEAKAAAAKAKAPGLDPTKATSVAADKAQKKGIPVPQKNEALKEEVAKADKNANGTLEFWINPWGDVFIDGKQVGTAPPLKVYKLPPGPHKVEIYNDNAGFPYKTTVDVKADQVLRINQTFR